MKITFTLHPELIAFRDDQCNCDHVDAEYRFVMAGGSRFSLRVCKACDKFEGRTK